MSEYPLMLFEAWIPDERQPPDPPQMPTSVQLIHDLPVPGARAVFGDVDDLHARLVSAGFGKGSRFTSIDLIAHGAPGVLSAGYTLGHVDQSKAASRAPRWHRLTSNPDVYASLAPLRALFQAKPVPLRLLGCHTASQAQPLVGGYGEVDGRVLMFALASLLDCTVMGTTDFIGAQDDYDDRGFKSPDKLVVLERGACVPVLGELPRPTSRPSSGPDVVLTPIPEQYQPRPPPIGRGALPGRSLGNVSRAEIAVRAGGQLRRYRAPEPQVMSARAVTGLLDAYSDTGRTYGAHDGFLLLKEAEIELASGDLLEVLSGGRYLRWLDRRRERTVLFVLRTASKAPGVHQLLATPPLSSLVPHERA